MKTNNVLLQRSISLKLKVALILLFTQVFYYQTFAQYPAGSPVAVNGKLKIVGNQLSNECGNPVQLRGMSTHGPQWFGNCYNAASLDVLVKDWGIDIFRIAMYVQEGGYVNNPTYWKGWIDNMVDECAKRGIYCMIDWHVMNPGDPNVILTEARDFWSYMSAKHAGKKHVLYEIANEPNGVTWATVKNYANDIIPRIRANDPSTVIIVGTPTWSQDVDVAANDPLNYSNLMYALHFYSGTHTDWLRSKANTALSKGLAIYVTEFGTSQATGDGGPYLEETQRWIDWMATNKISWINWSFADKAEVSAALNPGACGTNWNNTSQSGTFIKQRILSPADNFVCNPTGGFTITASSGTGGSITPNGSVSVAKGANQTFTISPSTGYQIADVKVNGASVGAVGSYTFTNVQANHSIAASFSQVTSSRTPYAGTPYAIPGTIEAENFDKGGQGVAFNDSDATNSGGQYRTSEGVDIETSTDGGYNVGWTNTGEWLEYTVNVSAAGSYKIDARVASAGTTGKFRIEFNGTNATSTLSVPSTGGWQTWTTISKTVSLSAGQQVMRIYVEGGGFNINKLTLSAVSTTTSNIAVGKPATASSVESTSLSAGNAVDGNATTRWASQFSDPQWIYVDLGATYTISRVKLVWEAAYGRDFKVQVSTNASTWTDVRTVTGNTSTINDFTGLTASGRYVRAYGTARATTWGYSLYELEVYGTSAARMALNNGAKDSKVNLYPNPTNQGTIKAQLPFTEAEEVSVSVVNMIGKNVLQHTYKKVNDSEVELNVSNLPAGVYIIRFSSSSSIWSTKFIKQ